MKTYAIYCVKSFDCNVEGKDYRCVRAMIGELEKVGSIWKIKCLKMIKCKADFQPVDLNKPCSIFFDENGKAVTSQLIG